MALAIGLWFMKDIPLPKSNYERWIEQASMKSRTTNVVSNHPLKMYRR